MGVMLWFRRALPVVAALAALVLLLALAGLLPAREPDAPDVVAFDVKKAVTPSSPLARVEAPVKGAPKATTLPVSWVPLCEAPETGARMSKLRLFGSDEALLVWCKQGYSLFMLERDGTNLRVTRMARFRTRAELPGGHAAGDFDGDGQLDLALGVGARPGVVHRSGAGVFWVRGRAQGGFEPPRVLVEATTVALAAHQQAGATRHELLVLTAGDVAAQRPGELWLFGMQPSLVRQRVIPAALDPRALVVRPGADANAIDAWVLTGQPGRVQRTVIDLATRDVRKGQEASLNLRGAQGFAHEPALEGALFVRDATSLYSLKVGDAPALQPFAERANLGPFVVRDFNGDLKPDVVAAMESGIAFIEESGAAPKERELPAEIKVLDVESTPSAEALVLVTGKPDPSTLGLLVLPKPPWSSSQELVFTRGELVDAPGLAEVVLE